MVAAGPKKLAVRFGVSERTAKGWIDRGAPATRKTELAKAAARSRRSKRAARTMLCRRSLLAFSRDTSHYGRRGISGEFFDKETCAVFAQQADGATVRLQILVGESGDHYPQWADAKKMEGYANDPQLNFAYQGNLQRKNISRLVIFFPECCGKAARRALEEAQREAEASFSATSPEWLKAFRRKRKKTAKRKRARKR